MRDTKLYSIIKKLSSKDSIYIERKLKDDSSKYGYKLFKTFIDLKHKEISREDIFQYVFKTKYAKSKDALLRNEMKRLIDKIEKIGILQLMEEDNKNECIINQYRFRFYIKLEMEDEAAEILNELSQELEISENFQAILDIKFQFIHLLSKLKGDVERNSIYISKIYKDYEALLYKSISLEYRKYLYLKRTENSYKRFVQNDFIKEDWNDEMQLTIDSNQHLSLLSRFYDLKRIEIKLVAHHSKKEIDKFYNLVNDFEKHRNIHPNTFTHEYINTLYTISKYLSYIAEFEVADTYFTKLFSIATPDNFSIYTPAILEYATNLNKLKKYEKGLQLLNSIDKTVLQENPIWQIYYDAKILMCYIGLKDMAGLYSLMQKKSEEKSPFQKIYNRMGICCLQILQKEYVAAENEMANIIRTKLLGDTIYEYVPLFDFFHFVLKQLSKYNDFKNIPIAIKEEIRNKKYDIETKSFERVKGYFPYIIFVDILNLNQL